MNVGEPLPLTHEEFVKAVASGDFRASFYEHVPPHVASAMIQMLPLRYRWRRAIRGPASVILMLVIPLASAWLYAWWSLPLAMLAGYLAAWATGLHLREDELVVLRAFEDRVYYRLLNDEGYLVMEDMRGTNIPRQRTRL